ncbi:UDP-N-acetylglucosamine--N-acetylmuramyl-(pentapeptide) pyrophosphoryl-undecaprenol N-acetylglucosamine transferase [Candidatus Gottesmanbacteria bacterium]|nr:UDP-N-acetylglucosamine--N-acetylmuramyl-(pentapeptide) pyrophosphoryl-undecaprenol N-acetylglucosamine transferase [Candidatus Gottesmanbacteria bacterium]
MAKTIVLCGGHLTPALALCEEIQKDRKFQLAYFGRYKALEGDTVPSLEYMVMKRQRIPFYAIPAERLSRFITLRNILSFAQLPFSIFVSLYFLLRVRPSVVISFGGYVALPVCFAAFLLRIPVVVHEQTHVLGLTNRVVSYFAKLIFLSWEDTESIPDGVKTIVSGNLLRESFFADTSTSLLSFGNRRLPILYVTGGSIGSQTINRLVEPLIATLCQKFRILHQCGGSQNSIDYKRLKQMREKLPSATSQNYRVVQSIDPGSVGVVLRSAHLVIGRAGANTVTELLASATPAILIPLPWAGGKEQERNAKYLVDLGVAIVLPQKNLSSDTLLEQIERLSVELEFYKSRFPKKEQTSLRNAAKNVLNHISTLVLGETT